MGWGKCESLVLGRKGCGLIEKVAQAAYITMLDGLMEFFF